MPKHILAPILLSMVVSQIMVWFLSCLLCGRAESCCGSRDFIADATGLRLEAIGPRCHVITVQNCLVYSGYVAQRNRYHVQCSLFWSTVFHRGTQHRRAKTDSSLIILAHRCEAKCFMCAFQRPHHAPVQDGEPRGMYFLVSLT